MRSIKRNSVLIIIVILHSVFLILHSTPASAQNGLIPTPTGSCPRTCLNLDGIPPTCTQWSEMACYSGKCVGEPFPPSAAQIEQSNLPCNYTLEDIVRSGVNFANLIFGITGSLMLLMFVYGGQQLLVARGNQEDIQKAKATLTAAFVGAIIILAAHMLIRFTGALLGVEFGVGEEAGLGQTVIPR